MILMNGCKIVNGDKMKKIKNFVLMFIIFCIALCGCGNSNLLDFDEPAFKEKYEEITDSLCTACIQPMLSTQLYGDYNYESWSNPYETAQMFNDTVIDLQTIKIDNIGNVYKSGGNFGFDVKFCGIDISFCQVGYDETESASFVLMLTSGMYNYGEVSKGFTDTRMDIQAVADFVNTFDDMLSETRKKSDIKIDYYAENIDMEYLNKMLSEKLEEYVINTSSNTENLDNNTIEDNYREVLNACNQEDTENNFTYREYYITDINNDDIPELIIHIGRNIKDVEYIIYTYKDNKIYECGVSGGNLSIKDEDEEKLERLGRESQEILSKDDNCIYISFCYAGYQHTSKIKLNDDLLLDVSDYYDSGSEKLSDYNIPGEILESADFLDNDLLVSVFTKTANESQTVVTTKSVTTKENIMTVPITTTKEKSDDKTYSITFEADELIEEAGLQLGGHVGVAVLSNLTCSNGNANIETKTIYSYDSLVKVEVTGAKAGEVVLGGTITTYGLDMFEGETVSYPDDSGVFLISKTVGEVSDDKPYVNGYIETYSLSEHDGSKIRLYLDGDFSFVSVQIQNQEYTSEVEFYSKEDFDDYIEMNFNPFAQPLSVAYVTPYSDSGVSGDIITCDIPSDAIGTIQTGGMFYPVDNMKGQINCHGGTVTGFTTDYVVNGGAVDKVRSSLGDTWHVTAKNACDNYGVTWYELWDSDDGDYYGWVDSSYIDFY